MSRPNSSATPAPTKYQRAIGRGVKRSSNVPSPLLVTNEALLPLGALGQRDRIQHRGALVAKDREGAADGAGRLVVAVAAWRVEIDARAGNERDRPFHRTDDL